MKQNRVMENYLQHNFDDNSNLKTLLESNKYLEANGTLVFPIGIDDEDIHIEDLSKISSALITGITGSGKTSFIHSLIASLIMQYTPDELKFIIADSKGIDYCIFKDMPHLMIPIITEPKKVCGLLNWVLSEVKRRLSLVATNKECESEQIVLIIDDFSLAAQHSENFEYMQQILALCRTVNIHCILCTSIPTTDIIPAALKTNIPYKIAFCASSRQLSKLAMDEFGAEMLNVPGEALIKKNAIQIKCNKSNATDAEIGFIAQQVKQKFGTYQLQTSQNKIDIADELIEEAKNIILETGTASASLLQRKLKVGYEVATKIIELINTKERYE